jgi:hypothetical protein
MKKIFIVGLAVATIFATAQAAVADTYSFSFNGAAVNGVGPAIEGSGQVTLTSLGGGAYNLASASLFQINGYSANVVGNPSPGNVSYYYINGQNVASSCTGVTDYCITFDNKLTNVAPGTAPVADYPGGLLFKFTEGGNPVELIIWQDDVATDPYYGQTIWTEYMGANGGGGYDNGGYWVIPPSTDDGQGGIPLDLYIGPEPSSLLLLGTGLLCMAGFVFWKSRLSLVKAR